MDGVEQGQGGAETTTASAPESTPSNADLVNEIGALKAGLQDSQAKFDQLVSLMSQQQSQVSQQKSVNYEELVKNDLPTAIKLAAKETAKIEFNEMKKHFDKQSYDEKVEKDFPLVKSDKAFREATLNKMRELVGNGEYSTDSPYLAYRAAEMTAAKFTKTASSGSGGMTGEAPRTGGSGSGNKPAPKEYDAWMSVFGNLIKDKEGMKARFETFKGKGGRK
jgi:hypothetical protein